MIWLLAPLHYSPLIKKTKALTQQTVRINVSTTIKLWEKILIYYLCTSDQARLRSGGYMYTRTIFSSLKHDSF